MTRRWPSSTRFARRTPTIRCSASMPRRSASCCRQNRVQKGTRAVAARALRQRCRRRCRATSRTRLDALDRRGWNVVLQVEDERALAADARRPDEARQRSTSAPPGRERRHRIELARPMALDVARLKALGVAVSLPLPGRRGRPAARSPTAHRRRARPRPNPKALRRRSWCRMLHAGLKLLMASESLADPRLGLQALVDGRRRPTNAAPSKHRSRRPRSPRPSMPTRARPPGPRATSGGAARSPATCSPTSSFSPPTCSRSPPTSSSTPIVTVTIFDGKVVYDREAETAHTEP